MLWLASWCIAVTSPWCRKTSW